MLQAKVGLLGESKSQGKLLEQAKSSGALSIKDKEDKTPLYSMHM